MSATPTLLRLRPLHSAAAPARRRWLLAACALLSLLLGVFALRRASSPASEEELLRVALARVPPVPKPQHAVVRALAVALHLVALSEEERLVHGGG